MRVLVTAFEPFGGEPFNPSQAILEELADDAAGADVELARVVLPVDRTRLDAALEAALDEHAPDLVVMVGQATGRGVVHLERCAHNALDFRGQTDNGGHGADGGPLERGGPGSLDSNLPLDQLAARLRAEDLPVHVSSDAGRHLCNAALYAVLRRRGDGRAVFVHVPLIPAQAARRDKGEPSLELDTSRRCVERLLTLLATPPSD